MGFYLLQATYTPESWAGMVKAPQNRLQAIRPVIQRLGGKIEQIWLSFGEYDTVAILELPDHVSAAAFSIAASAGGGLKAIKTTPLMTVEEGVKAMSKAAESGYVPPRQ